MAGVLRKSFLSILHREMTFPTMKRKFEEIEQAAHICIETLTGYEKCLLQNKLLLARSRMMKYENVTILYEAQIAMAKLDVELATSDIDLLLQELQRGKRFKAGEAISTISTFTQTDSQPTFSPTKSVNDTSRISFDLPSVDLTSFTRKRSDNCHEPSTSQEQNAQESTTSQGSKDSGYNSSLKSLLISQETTTMCNSSPKGLVNQEIQVNSHSDKTKESDTATVKSIKKCKPKKKVPATKDKPEPSKISNKKLKSTKDVPSSDKIKTNSASEDKPTNEKPSKLNKEVHNINEKTQKIDDTKRKSVQRRQTQDNRYRKRDERKSDSHNRRDSAESQKKTTDCSDSFQDMPKHQEKTVDRKSPKDKCDTKDGKQNPNRNGEGIKLQSKSTSKPQNVEPSNTDRKGRDNVKSNNKHQYYGHKEGEKMFHQAQNESEQSQKNSEQAQESNSNRRKNTIPRIKNNEPVKENDESKKSDYRSKEITLIIEEDMELETARPNQVLIEDFAPYDAPHDSPIHYTDFENIILSSVAVPDASINTRNTDDVLNSQNTIAQSTPFVRRFATVEHIASEYQDSPPSELFSDDSIIIEDQLTAFIRTTLADYNRDVAELNLTPVTHTITDKDKKTINKNTMDKTATINCKTTEINNNKTTKDKTTKINEGNTCENTDKYENTQMNDKTINMNAYKINIKPTTPEKMNKTTKQNLMVKIPVTRVASVINHINPTVVKIPVTRLPVTMNQKTTKVKQPCLTVAVNDAGVITIRPRSAESSNPQSPKSHKTVEKTHKQNIQDNIHSTTLPDPKKPTIKTTKEYFKSQDGTSKTPVKITAPNAKHIEMPTETASYMSQVQDQYYFDVDTPKLADEAPTHKNVLSLFRAYSILMPPSPTFTLSSSRYQYDKPSPQLPL